MNASVKIARLKDILDEVRGDGTRTVNQQLEVLIDRFAMAVRVIDPSITKVWVCRGGEGLDQPCFVSMEREEGASARRIA
jgi:hypothetical protein